jgi:hypothetical protein
MTRQLRDPWALGFGETMTVRVLDDGSGAGGGEAGLVGGGSRILEL